MTFEEFSTRAQQIFEEIPADYKAGVDGLEATRRTVLHPTLPDVYTLGECLSEFYPSDFGGPGEVRSRVVLYYGSFLELSRSREGWSWEDELWETITHEVRHHLEHLASEDALDEMDYAEDQNFARREGERFDPFFFRAGERIAPGIFEVDGDLFIEMEIGEAAIEQTNELMIPWQDGTLRISRPDALGDVHFLRVTDVRPGSGGDLFIVLVRKRGAAEWLRGLFSQVPLRVLESEAAAQRG
jgi:hypothetical protein